MSASKDKKLRQEQKASGYVDKRVLAAEKEAAERRKSNIKYTVIGIVLVVLFAFIFIYNSAWPARTFTAVTIDGQEYTAAEVNYHYSASYMNFYNTYGAYMDYGLFFDTTQSLADQEYSEDMTWRDYFMDMTIDSMTEIQLLNNAAEAASFVLPEDYQAQYTETVESFKNNWALYGYSSLEQYIALNYGKGVTMETLEEQLYRTYIAAAYSEAIFDGYAYSTDELDAYYAEHADELDSITYTYVSNYDGTLDVNAIADAVNGTDEESFHTYMHENHEGTEPVTLTYAGANLTDAYAEWLLDDTRVAGDAAAFETENDSYYAVMFLKRDTNDYNTVNFRHVLAYAEDIDADGAYSEDELAAAVTEAEALLADWQAGDATEESFAELANTYSDDGGSNTTGGLYETVFKNQMVAAVNDWIFAEGRQVGDVTIVTNNDANYAGAHILYFAGENDATYAQTQADTSLRNEEYNAWIEALVEGIEVSTKNMNLCGKHL